MFTRNNFSKRGSKCIQLDEKKERKISTRMHDLQLKSDFSTEHRIRWEWNLNVNKNVNKLKRCK